MEYTCSVCNVRAIVLNDGKDIIRPCAHQDAAVIAHCSAMCYGESSMAETPHVESPQG